MIDNNTDVDAKHEGASGQPDSTVPRQWLNIDIELRAIKAARDAAKRAENRFFMSQLRNRIGSTVGFWWGFIRAWLWVWNKTIRPILRFFGSIFSWVWMQYKFLWNRITYVKDKFGDRRFSVPRGGIMLITTFIFMWYLLIPLLGFAADGFLYIATVRKGETVWLSNSYEIYPDSDIHAVQGCYISEGCSDSESVYFRVSPSLFNEIWSLWNGKGLFFPDLISAAVPPSDWTECIITRYGFRAKLLMGLADIYPKLLEVTCQKTSK
jgi:hypothetical protein